MKICSISGCKNNVWSKNMCNKHRQRSARGTLNKKTWADPNDVLFENNSYYLVTYSRNGEFSAKSIIDKDDIDKVLLKKWNFRKKDGYIVSSAKGDTLFLHHYIIGNRNIVDHINRNRLDNRKENLRNVTYQQNMLNTGVRKDSKTGIKGVRFDARRKTPWYCTIHINGKSFFGGYFTNKEDAIKKRKYLEEKHHQPIWHQ